VGTTRWNRVGAPSSPEHAIGDKRAPLPRGPFRRYAADLRTRVRGGVIRASAGKSGHRDTDANVPKATLGPPSIGVRMPRTLPFFGVVPRFTLVDGTMNANAATKPGMMPIENLAKNGLVCVLKPRCTTTSERIGHWTKMRW